MSVQQVPRGPAAGAGPRPAPPPAGWYRDPGDPHRLRLWDGHVWTEHVSQMPVSSWSVPIAVHQRSKARSPAGFGWVTFAGVAFLVIALLMGYLEGVSHRRSPTGAESAEASCRQAVATRLQTPRSARFSSLRATEGAPDYWTVTGAVDSLSAVGFTERMLFTCFVSPDEDGHWQLDVLRLSMP